MAVKQRGTQLIFNSRCTTTKLLLSPVWHFIWGTCGRFLFSMLAGYKPGFPLNTPVFHACSFLLSVSREDGFRMEL